MCPVAAANVRRSRSESTCNDECVPADGGRLKRRLAESEPRPGLGEEIISAKRLLERPPWAAAHSHRVVRPSEANDGRDAPHVVAEATCNMTSASQPTVAA